MTLSSEQITDLIDSVRDRPTITRMYHVAQIKKIEVLRDALASEHQRADGLEANRAAWTGDAFEVVKKAEAERDALHAALIEIRANMWRYCLEYPYDGHNDRDPVERILSRAIDTKETK